MRILLLATHGIIPATMKITMKMMDFGLILTTVCWNWTDLNLVLLEKHMTSLGIKKNIGHEIFTFCFKNSHFDRIYNTKHFSKSSFSTFLSKLFKFNLSKDLLLQIIYRTFQSALFGVSECEFRKSRLQLPLGNAFVYFK